MDLNPEQDAAAFLTSRQYTIWELIRSFWKSQHKFSAWSYTAAILALTILLVGFDVVFNYWYNYFYNALQEYNMHAAIRLLFFFFLLAGFYIFFAVYRYFFSQKFALRWR